MPDEKTADGEHWGSANHSTTEPSIPLREKSGTGHEHTN